MSLSSNAIDREAARTRNRYKMLCRRFHLKFKTPDYLKELYKFVWQHSGSIPILAAALSSSG